MRKLKLVETPDYTPSSGNSNTIYFCPMASSTFWTHPKIARRFQSHPKSIKIDQNHPPLSIETSQSNRYKQLWGEKGRLSRLHGQKSTKPGRWPESFPLKRSCCWVVEHRRMKSKDFVPIKTPKTGMPNQCAHSFTWLRLCCGCRGQIEKSFEPWDELLKSWAAPAALVGRPVDPAQAIF